MVDTAKLTELQDTIALYIAARRHILQGGQSYSIGNRSLTRADLRFVEETIERLQKEILDVQRSGYIRQQRIVPRDF